MKNADGLEFDSLYDDALPVLRRFAYGLCRHADDAEDLVMDTLLKAAKQGHGRRKDAPLLPWLKQTLKNQYIDSRRRVASHNVSLDALCEEYGDYGLPMALHGGDPAVIVAGRMAVKRILSLSLHPSLMQDVALHGYSLPELAERDGVSLDVLTGRYQRDRKRVGRLLQAA